MSPQPVRAAPPRALRPPVVIAGFGRLGGALALGLRERGWPVSVSAASPASVRAARKHDLPLADDAALRAARVLLVTVQDGAVGARVEALCPRLSDSCALVHCAGALPLQALGASDAIVRHPRGSFHPLAAVSSRETSLAGRTVALSATTPALRTLLKRMARDLGLPVIEVPEQGRAAYHAGAVLSAGGAVALLATAVDALEHAGLREDEALRALLPLMRSALDGVEARGLAGGLTGPVARADAGVVAAHVKALPGEVREIYRALSLRMLGLTALSPEARRRVRRALKA